MDVNMPTKSRKRKKPNDEVTGNPEWTKKDNANNQQPNETISIAPRGINVSEFIECRALEIKNMSNALKEADASRGKRAFQMMPRHMRRRAASHNIKRIPQRLREKAEAEVAIAPPKATKRPSRKFRRRPSNLLQEYQRRQRKIKWLETHIWHAKRFKMTDKWGFKIPFEPCDKSFRATYRASSNGCLMQDHSYMTNIEVSGCQALILSGLKHLSNPKTGLTFAAKMSLDGRRQGRLHVYSKDCYPFNCIGPVNFIWKPLNTSEEFENYDNRYRCLLLTFHPVMKDQLLKELSSVFVNDTKSVEQVMKGNDSVVTFKEVDLVRFSLRGELSHTVLNNALELCDRNISVGEKWWQIYYKDGNGQQQFLGEQHDLWRKLSGGLDPSAFPSSVVIGLTVDDPRLTTPMKKRWPPNEEKVVSDMKNNSLLKTWPKDIHNSPLWDATIRQQVKSDLITTHEINKIRSKLLVPGTTLKLGDAGARIPILLLHQKPLRQSNSQDRCKANSDYGCGWDVIIPSGWAMPFWVNFIYQGARAGGLRESTNMYLESMVPHFPEHYVDTLSGQNYMEERQKELHAKHLRYPPDKRLPYNHLCISSPFVPPFQELVNCWSSIEDQREKMIANDFAKQPTKNVIKMSTCTQTTPPAFNKLYVIRDVNAIAKLCELFRQCDRKGSMHIDSRRLNYLSLLSDMPESSLWAVSITSLESGCPEDNALISIPTKIDLDNFSNDKSFSHVEEAHKEKKKKLNTIASHEGFEEFAGIAGDCSRWTIGYCTNARYGLSHGKGIGLAYISSVGLNQLFHSQNSSKKIIVLYRNIKTLHYRFATIDVV